MPNLKKILSGLLFVIFMTPIMACDWSPEQPNIPDSTTICHPELMIVFDESVKLPIMSYAIHTQEQVWTLEGGRKEFIYDPNISHTNQYSPHDDVYKTPMSRGHLTPSDIMSYDKTPDGPWYSTYYISNVLPQNAKMNEDVWAHFEKKVIDTLKSMPNGTSWEVYTGGYWNGTRNTNPDYFWKAFCHRASCSSGLIMASHEPEPQWTTHAVGDYWNIFAECCPNHYNEDWDSVRL